VIRVCYSNQLEELVVALDQALPPPGRLFDGPWLVVPNRPLQLFIDLALARRRGISGNLDTLSMRGAFARLCTEAFPDVVLIERGQIVGELLALLANRPSSGGGPLAPIDDYLLGAGPTPDAIDRRRVEIARALATLFDDWNSTRPELIAAWRAGRELSPTDQDARGTSRLARAERQMWDDLFDAGGRFARRSLEEGRRYLTLEAFLAARLDEAWRPPTAIHVFGLAEMPRGLQTALDRLGARTSLTLYTFNPCREFWEDLDTDRRAVFAKAAKPARPTKTAARAAIADPRFPPRQTRQTQRQLTLGPLHDPFGLGLTAITTPEVDPENPFLRLWGRPGREAIRLFDMLCDCDFDARFVNPEDDGALLHRVQRDILDREARRAGPRRLALPADGSLGVLRAPDPRRELESVAAEIWKLVGRDGPEAEPARAPREPGVESADAAAPGRAPLPLRFCDIAVLIAGPDDPYLALAPAVFHEANDLPHTLVDQPLATASRLAEATLALLALPLGPLSRREVLDVLTHPNVRALFGQADPAVWLGLCEALGIAHGADRGALGDTYIDRDLFNWDQGCKRLALGRFAAGPRSGVDAPVPLPGPAGEDDYLPAELAPDLRPDADALSLLVRSLLGDVAFARDARLTVPGWIDFVHALIGAYLVPLSSEDEAARLRIFAALDQLAAASRNDLRVGLGVARELVRDALEGLRGGRGQIFGDGVVCGPLGSLRAIPFRVIFVVGLGPERFPSADRPAPLDPGGDRVRAGDVTPRQRDRYAFLEVLLATRERLALSYVARDPLTGDEREPSATLLELLEVLRDGYSSDPALVRDVPARRDEDEAVRATFPAAAAEARARAVGADLLARAPETAQLESAELESRLSAEARRALAPLLHIIAPPPPRSRPDGAPIPRRVLRLADFRRFLECPLQASARIFLGLRDLPDDTAARQVTDEPFGVPRAIERRLLGEVLATTWTGATLPDAATLVEAYQRAATRQGVAAVLPTGLFGAAVQRRHLKMMGSWLTSLGVGPDAPRGPARRVQFGRPEPDASPADARPPIQLRVEIADGAIDVEVHGATEPQVDFDGGRGSLVLATSANDGNDTRDTLRAFVDYLALTASTPEGQTPGPFQGAVCRPDTDKPFAPLQRVSFAALTPADARRYLSDRATELLGRAHAYLLPCEAVFMARKAQPPRPVTECVAQIRSDAYYRGTTSSAFGPVPEPFDYPVPTEDEASRMVEARFGLFFNLSPSADRPEKSAKGRRTRA
jgi:exodeoxyribonuclease V gamma subunit